MKLDDQPIITICTSSSFYQQAAELKEELKDLGYAAILPEMAEKMKKNNNFERTHYQPWLTDPTKYDVKAGLMHGHFDKVALADAILVINNEKHGVSNYIGGNVLMEMGLAFHLGIPIIILNDVPEDSSFKEEIYGMLPVVLKGKLSSLPKIKKLGSTASA